uniref:Uncharacterized protein n=1 Tax=Arundo donax TaxID=35708 RepID=A0A0A9UIV2_ARUDO
MRPKIPWKKRTKKRYYGKGGAYFTGVVPFIRIYGPQRVNNQQKLKCSKMNINAQQSIHDAESYTGIL